MVSISKMSAYTVDMTEGMPVRHILRFAVPLFIGTVFQQFYSFADTMIAGRCLGDQAIAAIGASAAIYSLLIAFANGMNSGYGIVLSRAFGAKNQDKCRRTVATMLFLDVAIAALLTIAAVVFLKPILHWLDTPADIFDNAYCYILVILGGMITTVSYNMAAGFLRAVGNSRTPLYFLILSCVLNLGMDILFIVAFGMGIGGAAAATVIAQGISAFCCISYIWRNYRDFLPGKQELVPGCELLSEMLSTGLSMALMLSVFSLGSIVLQKGINNLGTQVITAHTASRRVYEMLMMPLATLATANATFVGQNFGAKRIDRINGAMKQVMLLELAWSVFSVLLVWIAGIPLLCLLVRKTDDMVIANAILNLRVCTVFFFPLGALFVLRNAMQPMGYKVAPVISSTIELVVKVLFCLWLIPRFGYMGVVATEPVIWLLCAVFLGMVYLLSQHKRKSVETAEKIERTDIMKEVRA